MNIELEIKNKIRNSLKQMSFDINLDDIVIEHSRNNEHGDYASNVALQLSKLMHKNPREIASSIIENIDKSGLDKIEIAGPGFINFFISKTSISSGVANIINENKKYGQGENKNFRINVEFVSANPTGDLHLGHARCAAIGDSICRLYEKAGYDVTREFYVNDAGSQIEHLGDSIRARYLTLLGKDTPVPEDGYHGADIIDIATLMKNEVGDKYLSDSKESHDYFIHKGMELELDKIKRDLNLFRTNFDIYSFESDIRKDDAIKKTIEEYKDHIYKKDGALFLKTTDYLDDKDRPIQKSNGQYTYFMPDICYHLNKLSRHFDLLVDILGADHHGYIARMKSALMMKGYSKDILEVELVQVVRIIKDGQEVKMSKRTGNAITLRELCEDVGVDAVRYFFVERASSSHLDFDFDLAMEHSSNNPVYYAQYAHARLSKLLESGKEFGIDNSASLLKETYELNLLKQLLEFPNIIQIAAKDRAPQKLALYIHSLAQLVHEFYTNCRVLDQDNLDLTRSRLALCLASKIVLENALDVIGVSAPDKM
jgi:arginyl-tRNA synthetase